MMAIIFQIDPLYVKVGFTGRLPRHRLAGPGNQLLQFVRSACEFCGSRGAAVGSIFLIYLICLGWP
jgi:hypothetical protein